MAHILAVWLFLFLELGQANDCTPDTWYHLMTVNPNDGQRTWHFDANLWYKGSFGEPDSKTDYINNRIRHIPIEKIKIVSKNRAGK